MSMGFEEDLDSLKNEYMKHRADQEKSLQNYVQKGDLEVKYVEFRIEIESLM